MISKIRLTAYSGFAAAIVVVLVTSSGCYDQKSSDNINRERGMDSDKATSGARSGQAVNISEPLLRFVEPVSDVKAPSEYLFLKSENLPDAVVVVTLPLDYKKHPSKRYPLVIAFGGAGECARAPREGALAWVKYYRMDEAVKALTTNHLEPVDFKGLVTQQQLTYFNNRLKKEPYSGVIVACPYSPQISSVKEFEDPKYERFIIDELIPLLKRRYRVAQGRVGVDGVSMGGARAMFFGLKYPVVFSSIGSSQGAFGPFMDTFSDLVHRNREVLKKRRIQLVTSDGDGMAPSVKKMRALLKSEGIPHTYLNLKGPHDYIFNQGPGSISLLMFHNTVQTRQSLGPVK